MSARGKMVLCATAAFVGLFGTGTVQAQNADQPAAGAADYGREEIITTARRREEKIQNVPLAITAFSSTDLQTHSITNLIDLQHSVPSYTFDATQRSGIGATSYLRGLPGVVSYFAEVPLIIGNQVGDAETFDLENLQVLKGPQGTLFGQNTTGGAILFEPKRPTPNFEGYIQALYGSYDWNQFQAVVNVPVIEDKLMIRIGGQRNERDGFTTVVPNRFAGRFAGTDLDNLDSWYARVGITFRPTDDIENYLVADSTYLHTNGTALILASVNPDKNFQANSINFLLNTTYAAAPPDQILRMQQRLGVRRILGFDQPETYLGKPLNAPFQGPLEKAQDYTISDIFRWDVSDTTVIKNIAGYVDSRQLTRSDFDDSPFVSQAFFSPRGYNSASLGTGGGAGTSTQYTEELQLQSKAFDDKLQYTIGGFLRYQTQGPASEIVSTGNAAISQILVNTGGGATSRTQALYAEGNYDMSGLWDALEGLKFTGGYRYNWDYASGYQHILLQTLYIPGLGAIPGSALIPALGTNCAGGAPSQPNNCDHENSAHFHSPGWNLELAYQMTPETMFYVRSSKGYRPGGFTPQAPTLQDQTYQPEYLTDVEVGVKTAYDVWGMHGRANVDAYHGFYTNIQTMVTTFVNILGSPSNFGVIENAAEATAEGVEWDFNLLPVKELELRLNGSYNHNVYTKFSSAAFGQLNGLSFPFFPRLKFNLGFTYHLPVDEAWGDVAFTLDWNYQTHVILSTDNGPSTEPTHRLTNLRIDWTNMFGEPVDLGFFITNLTDTEFPIGSFGLYNQQGFVSYDWNEPRMIGASVKYRFGGPSAPEAVAAPYTPPPPQPVVPAPARSYLVFFDFNKSDLTATAQQIVDQAASNAGPAKVTRLTVTGHTDTVGSDAYNMRLSRRRAESVAARLEKDGIASSEIEIVAKGKRDLLVSTADGVREPQNRRVQIVYDGGTTS